jgi:hypothetical protein
MVIFVHRELPLGSHLPEEGVTFCWEDRRVVVFHALTWFEACAAAARYFGVDQQDLGQRFGIEVNPG